MIEIVVIVLCVITLILLKQSMNLNFKKIKEINKRKSNELNELSKKFPENAQICKEILTNLNNKEVKIKNEPEYSSCLYTVFNNTITIGKFNQDYMKIQTIAHECIHSTQNKTTLWFNFIFTNAYLIYFFIIVILGIFNKLPYVTSHILILIFSSIIQYAIRNSLELEAMTKAKYVAKDYIERNKILNKEEEKKLLKEYEEVNDIGIPFMNYYTISGNIIKVIIFSIIILI